MWARLLCGLCAATLIGLAGVLGCGGPDLVIGGTVPPASVTPATTASPGTCQPANAPCVLDADCCSGACDATFNTCF